MLKDSKLRNGIRQRPKRMGYVDACVNETHEMGDMSPELADEGISVRPLLKAGSPLTIAGVVHSGGTYKSLKIG